ncbi:MAG TPA: tyrosine-type recombinase/integrase [Terriglobales bacterium]|nr:tyrosine-type recombinase/integrase [Terriglobales bacterium]
MKEAKKYSEQTVDGAAKALYRFEADNSFRDFKTFRIEQAIAFKRHLAEQKALRSGNPLSKATLYSTLRHLKGFFSWLAGQPGYRSRITYSDCEYFNLSEKDIRIATARREQKSPTLEQIKYVISHMQGSTEIEMRNRALIAFTILTGARDRAIISMKLKHVDLTSNNVTHDAREVKSKFSKTFTTFFFPVGDEILTIFVEWLRFLRERKLWGNDDPLFPATHIAIGRSQQFEASGLERAQWSTAAAIRRIFREAFTKAELAYYNPHSFRNTLVKLGEEVCQTAEEFKAWSQNLGHEKALTTFLNYGEVGCHRQGEIIRNLGKPRPSLAQNPDEFAAAVAKKLRQMPPDTTLSEVSTLERGD